MEFEIRDNISLYLSGQKLYGDDFTIKEIHQWYSDEAEGYAELGAKKRDQYQYVYHQLNFQHGFKYINKMQFGEVLGIGSAYGHEFKPIAHRIKVTVQRCPIFCRLLKNVIVLRRSIWALAVRLTI
ncbi:MAG: hypothetical protein U9O82_11470 [Thermodesulfobacteriota bacterium]|nr:hypothetical protein [Thermodesulfobacteriota bacterium]